MPSLAHLPDEVLLGIASNLPQDRASLRAIALTNRRLSELASTILYRTIHLRIRLSDATASFSKRFELFLHTIREQPRLGALVQYLTLRWFKGRRTSEDNDVSCGLANELLEKLPGLRSLEMRAGGHAALRFEPRFLVGNSLAFLRTLVVRDCDATCEDVVKYMMLESVTDVSIEDMEFRTDTLVSAPTQCNGSISKFQLGDHAHAPPQVLNKLLRTMPALRELRCKIPGVELRNSRSPYGRRMGSVLSPAGIGHALEPVQRCLTTLRLDDGTDTQWPSHDGSRLHLGDFVALRKVSVPAKCLFAEKQWQKSRQGVYTLLPPKLEHLNIHLDLGWDFLYDCKHEWVAFEASGYLVDEERYFWVREIIVGRNAYPQLERLTIEEQTTAPRGSAFDAFKWNIPLAFRDLCDVAGVMLTVWLRRPLERRVRALE